MTNLPQECDLSTNNFGALSAAIILNSYKWTRLLQHKKIVMPQTLCLTDERCIHAYLNGKRCVQFRYSAAIFSKITVSKPSSHNEQRLNNINEE